MRKQLTAGVLAASTLVGAAALAPLNPAVAGGSGPMPFTPLTASANGRPFDAGAPFIVPAGYRQYDVSNEFDLDIYPASPDWHDMNTVNETGPHAGRYLYRTHEVRGAENASNGSVSVVDLTTGVSKVLVQRTDWDALDGIRWTPWGTVLFAEETDGGKLYEAFLDRNDLTKATRVVERTQVGVMAHEGIDIDARGNVYVVDEFRGGAIFKFVPNKKNDLSTGELYALKVADDGSGLDVGQGSWIKLDRAAATANTRAAVAAANAAGAGIATFQRPEDIEIIGNVMYVAVTEAEPQEQAAGAPSGDGRVIAIDLKSNKVTNFVKGGQNVAAERSGVTGMKSPDNVAEGPDGRLWIVEDTAYSDIWVAGLDSNRDGSADTVELFASLTDAPAEGTGIYFGKDPHTLFVNIQHSGTGRDRTIAITNRKPDAELAAIGDTPYGAAAKANLPALVSSINANVANAVHVGDIKTGGSSCSDAYFAEIKAVFDTFESLVYTPGDNEWTDCHRTGAGAYNPIERLAKLRSVFYTNPEHSLGTAPMELDVQKGYPENVMWDEDDVVFSASHLVGSNNSMIPWSGIADDPVARIAEADARLAAAVVWLDKAFAEAAKTDAKAIVLFHQADMWEVPTDALTPWVQRLATRAAGFDGDVLLVQGDSHRYLVDHPLAEAPSMGIHGITTAVPNVVRVIVPGDVQAATRWLKISIDTDQIHPFAFERVAFA